MATQKPEDGDAFAASRDNPLVGQSREAGDPAAGQAPPAGADLGPTGTAYQLTQLVRELSARLADAEADRRRDEQRRRALGGEIAALADQLADAQRKLQLMTGAVNAASNRQAHAEEEACRLREEIEKQRVAQERERRNREDAQARPATMKEKRVEEVKAAAEGEAFRLRVEVLRGKAALEHERIVRLAALEQSVALRDELAALMREREARAATEVESTSRHGESALRKNELEDLRGQLASASAEVKALSTFGLDAVLKKIRADVRATGARIKTVASVSRAGRASLQAAAARMAAVDEGLHSLIEFFRRLPPPEPCDVKPFIEKIMKRWAPAMHARKIQVKSSSQPGLPKCLIHEARLNLAVNHLVRNAYEAMPNGGTLEVTLSGSGPGVSLRLRDNGPGFPEEVLAEQPALSRGSKPGCFGIGLALVGRIAASTGGSLRLEDAPGGGAVVELLMPLAE